MSQPQRVLAITAITLFWCLGIVTYATIQMFSTIDKINGSAAAAYAALLGIPPAVLGLYQWARTKV